MNQCRLCTIEIQEGYRFCSAECSLFHYWGFEKQGLLRFVKGKTDMANDYEIDKEVYMKWFEDKTIAIEAMTKEQIEARITELAKMEFFIRREWSMLHQNYDKLTGRKGIPPWLKSERDKLITDPNIKVNFDEPRKKETKADKEKRSIKNLLGLDIDKLKQDVKAGKVGGNGEPVKATAKAGLGSLLDSIANSKRSNDKPVEDTPSVDITAKANSLKEKMAAFKNKKV